MTDLDCVRERLTAVESNQKHMGRKIDDMHRVIVGNGDAETGIISRLANIKGQVKAAWIVIGLGATAFTGLVLALITYAARAN